MKWVICIFLCLYPSVLLAEETIPEILQLDCPEGSILQYSEKSKELPMIFPKKEHPAGSSFSFCLGPDSKVNGPYKGAVIYPEGESHIVDIATFKDSLLHGEKIEYILLGEEDGKKTPFVSRTSFYRNGVVEGCITTYLSLKDNTGTYKYEEECFDGDTRVLRGWFPNGQLSFVNPWSGSRMDGKWLSWYENGKRKSLEEYEEGENVGLAVRWKNDGSIEEAFRCKDHRSCTPLTKEELIQLELGSPAPDGWEEDAKRRTEEALKSCEESLKKIQNYQKLLLEGKEVSFEDREEAVEKYKEATETLNSVFLEMQDYQATVEELLQFAKIASDACNP